MKKIHPLISTLLTLSLFLSSASGVMGAEAVPVTIPEATPGEIYSENLTELPDDSLPDDSLSDDSLPDDSLSDDSLSDISDIGPVEEAPKDTTTAEEARGDLSRQEEPMSDLSGTDRSEEAIGSAFTATPTPTEKAVLSEKVSSTYAVSYSSSIPANARTYTIACAADSDYCLDIKGGSLNQNANLQIYKKNDTDAQRFTLKKLGDGSYVIYNFNSDKVISVNGNSAVKRANVTQRKYTGSNLQKWILKKNTDGSYGICSKSNQDLRLHIQMNSFKNGQNIYLYSTLNSKAQKFTFQRFVPTLFTEEIMLRPKYVSYMAVGSNGSIRDGANLQLEIGASGDLLQTYKVIHVWGAFYKLLHVRSGKVVDVTAGTAANGTNIQLYGWNNTAAQMWKVQANSDGSYTFRSRANLNYVLDMAAGGRSAGTNLQLYSFNNTTSQKFIIKKLSATLPENIDLTIASTINTDRVFYATGSTFTSYDYANTEGRKFKLIPVTYGGTENFWYKIETSKGKVLGVDGTSAQQGLYVSVQDWEGTRNQLWNPKYMKNGSYVIRSALNLAYLMTLYGSSEDYWAKIQICRNNASKAQRWHLDSYTVNSCKISSSDHNTVTVKATGSKVNSDDKKAYLFAVAPYEHVISGKSPIASTGLATSLTFTAGLNKNSSSSILQKKFYVAVKYCGMYRIVSNAYYIMNPEAAATNTKSFPTPARGTKKGLKLSVSDQDIEAAKNMKVSHACIDLPVDLFYGETGYSYSYEGKTYQFSGRIASYKKQIKKYNDSGIVVTANIYLMTKNYPELLQPEARRGSKLKSATLVGYNTRDAGRKKLEALFACLAEAFTTDGCLVANWVFANEVNQYLCYYYCGDISYYRYHEALAEGYRMFNASVKSRWKNARCYISMDHNWNIPYDVPGSFMGMDLIKDVHLDLCRQGKVHWDMAMHPYPAPEQDCRFWNPTWTVTNSGDSPQITMLNLKYWAVYLKMKYGPNVHIILNETGLSSNYNGTDLLNEQAAAVALAYYMAEFDSNVDEMDIHRNIDDPSEVEEGWHLGLYYKPANTWNYSMPKPSANVFRYMDSASWSSATMGYVPLTGKSSWKAWVPGFDADRFASKS